MPTAKAPHDVIAIRKKITAFLNSEVDGRFPGRARCGVYAFYDYDGEPIYVGQTVEQLRGRIGRHLTNRRTDAVAMSVLDPFEVAEIEVYPFYDLEAPQPGESEKAYKARRKDILARAEFTVFQKVLGQSHYDAVLNEKDVPPGELITLPEPHRGSIIPDDLYEARKHPDTRIARRASTIANLARVISEREGSGGLRRTLLTQARRLEVLATKRLAEFSDEIPTEEPGEETGESES